MVVYTFHSSHIRTCMNSLYQSGVKKFAEDSNLIYLFYDNFYNIKKFPNNENTKIHLDLQLIMHQLIP